MSDLLQRSVEIILSNQHASGAYLACPNFPTYHYCWFRDGAYTAYAMDLVGEHASAARFHAWAAGVILPRAEIVKRAVAKAQRGERLTGEDWLHTRYTVDGQPSNEDWPNFQLDGFGTWLWSLAEHYRLAEKPVSEDILRAARLVAAYLAALWKYPCFDCWEEFPDQIHIYTLAAIYGGLMNFTSLSGMDQSQVLSELKAFILENGIRDGCFSKYVGSVDVDASLVGLAVPYQVLDPVHPLMKATVARIESCLRRGGGGVHRYVHDTYYGGGEWVLLTAWLGWYYSRIGEGENAQALMRWVEAQADEQSQLPEQVPATLNDPALYEPWRQRWGEIARPLLWSHAKYIILRQHLGE